MPRFRGRNTSGMLENIKAGTSAARNKILFREAEEMQLVHHGGPEDHAAEIAFHNTSKGMRDENSAEALCHFPPPNYYYFLLCHIAVYSLQLTVLPRMPVCPSSALPCPPSPCSFIYLRDVLSVASDSP